MADKIVIRIQNSRSSKSPEPPDERTITVYYWHRIIPAVVILLGIIVAVFTGINHWLQRPDTPDQPISVAEMKIPAKNSPLLVPAASQVPKSTLSIQQPIQEKSPISTQDSAAAQNSTPQTAHQGSGVLGLQLTRHVADGQPAEPISGFVPMNRKGLVKIFLSMETAGLKGHVLFHDWYWKHRLIAHARVPISRDTQTAFTSKFIDRIMVGPWRVVVVDEHKKVLAETGFEVR